jgi:parvulin-like peptidyl-prolyl isomerase
MLRPILFVSLSFLSTSAMARTLVDRLVAEVDDTPITYVEVLDKAHLQNVIVSTYPATENSSPFDAALQDLINTELVLAKAAELGIEFSDERTTQRINEIMQEQNLTMDQLVQVLREQGTTYEQYFKDAKMRFLVGQFIGGFIVPQVNFTEKELETYYMKTSGIKEENVKVTLRQILLTANADNIEAKKAQANDVINKLNGGLAFDQAVQQFSEAPDAKATAGLMPSLALSDLSQEFRQAIAPLEVGQFTQPIVTGFGVFIFYVENKEIGENEDFAKNRQELEYRFRQEKAFKQLDKWLAGERNKSNIRVLTGKES